MKSFVFVALLALATQAHVVRFRGLRSIQRTMPEVDGAPKYNSSSRIISGIEAHRGQIPYQAGLLVEGGFCGGSLISQRWVLTAAHCASNSQVFTVILGAQDLDNISGEPGRIILVTTQKIVHSGYNNVYLSNDIALLNLNREVALSLFIQVVPLASGNNQYIGATARTSGWGQTSNEGSVNPQLSYVDVTVISNEECTKTFGSSVIRPNILCTRGDNYQGVCNGDSGGPLVDHASGKQIGITSFVSREGCLSHAPNGYVRITSHAVWISVNSDVDISKLTNGLAPEDTKSTV